jgi:Sulfatase
MRQFKPVSFGAVAAIGIGLWAATLPAFAQQPASAMPPNILVIMADDIGYWNVSAYNRGQMGYRTPNIDRIANEGALFTDYYGQQSCTAGRAAFITGQSPMRTGLLKVGSPGAKEGLSEKDPTLAELLKPLGYMTAQFGKNHLGDRNEFLPTVHGFDEFFGNLYHLNAEDEPEHPDYPKNLEFRLRFGPIGKQNCEDTGPLTMKRMETEDEEARGSVRTFGDRGRRLRQVVRRTRVCLCPCASDCGAAPGDIPGFPAATKAWQLLGRRGDGDVDETERQQLAASSRRRGGIHEVGC